MTIRRFASVLLAGLLGAATAQAQTPPPAGSAAEPSNTTTTQESRRGVPGVDVDVNRSGRDRGVPGVDASVGADGDQRNVDTRASGAGRAARADRN
jgi:hypothetical protein